MTAPALTSYAPAADLLEIAADGVMCGLPLAEALDGSRLAAKVAVYAILAATLDLDSTGGHVDVVRAWEATTPAALRRAAYYDAAYAVRRIPLAVTR
jgi:hypothetical protein